MARKNEISYITSDMNKVDLYVKFKTTSIDEAHQFVEHVSEVYNCREFIFEGYMKKGLSFALVTKDGQVVPSYKAYNFLGGPGYTFDDEKTNAELEVHDALVIKDGGTTYNYINENSKLVYKGKFRKVTLFVRVYDDFNGDNNKRWVAINLQ